MFFFDGNTGVELNVLNLCYSVTVGRLRATCLKGLTGAIYTYVFLINCLHSYKTFLSILPT
jgi:hypothetical protein